MALAFSACSPEKFDGVDPNGLPSLSGVDFTLNVDQEVNQITASYPEVAGQYPVWIINGSRYSTLNEVDWSNTEAGTYTVELRLGNRNGITQTGVKKEFTFNETKVDFTNYFNRLTGKEWRIANAEPAHLACGPSGTAGVEWWSAGADEKKDWGVYDDRLVFTQENRKGGNYTYNPGEGGTMYVNTGCSVFSEFNTNDGQDFLATVNEQTTTYSFEAGTWTDAEGNEEACYYLVFPAHTQFPYISSDDQWENPRFRIESITAKKLSLVYDIPGTIAWHFILTSEGEVKAFDGFDANNDFNMWKGITPNMSFYYNPDPAWGNEQTALFESLFELGNNDYTVTVPSAGYDQWQAQVHFHTDINTVASSNYDFSVILNADKDVNGATVKLTNEADGSDFYFAENVDLKAGEDYVFWKSDMPGLDLQQIKLVFDFGRAGDDTHINIRNVVLKDHANDDGTVLPSDQPGGGDEVAVMDWNYDAASNLWKAVDDGTLFEAFGYYFADNGWGGIPYNEATHNGDTYELTLPEGLGGSQWQGQFHIDTKLTASASKAYNFYLVMEASNDCPQVTFKLTDAGDSNYFFEERHDVPAGEYVFKKEGVVLKDGVDAEAIRLFFDFGGSPAGTNIKISKIYFEEAVSMNYDDADNLWKAVDNGSLFDAFGYYFADNGWGAIPYNEATHSGDTYELTLPEGLGGSQWQGQFHIDTKLTASASKSYNFQLQMEVENDCPGVTIKLTDAGDTNFFCEGRHDIEAGEPFVFTLKGATLKEGVDADAIRLFFDFGGSPGGTKVKISKIIFKEN